MREALLCLITLVLFGETIKHPHLTGRGGPSKASIAKTQ